MIKVIFAELGSVWARKAGPGAKSKNCGVLESGIIQFPDHLKSVNVYDLDVSGPSIRFPDHLKYFLG